MENGDNKVAPAGQGGEKRQKWGGQLEFILTLVGYAVGLGNIWRFPYLCFRNGGGAFLIPYFGTLALVGLPLFYMELAFGQFASLGPIKIWTINPLFKGLGIAMVMTNTMIGVYYNVIISWVLYFLFSSFTSELPWSSCNNTWNTILCVPTTELKNLTDPVRLPDSTYVNKSDLKSPSEEFFYNGVLKVSDGIEDAGEMSWQLALCLLLAWLIIFFVLIKGISSLGKVVYFTTIFPYILLTVMLIRGVTLEGAREGIIFYLKPDFNKLANAQAWSDAATQIFFSLSVATGGLTAMASYNDFKNNCYRDAVMIPIINCATSFYGGFAIFSVLGYMAFQKGVTVDKVAAGGPGLVFVAYPEALATMPVAPLWSILFFLMMLTLGLSSMFSITETFFTSFADEFPELLTKTRLRNIVFRIIATTVFYLIGLSMVTEGGFYVFTIFDFYLGGFPLMIIGLLETLVVCLLYGWPRFSEDVQLMLGKKPNYYFMVTLCILVPVILFAMIIFTSVQFEPPTLLGKAYPDWAQAFGFLLIIFVLIWIPIWWVYLPIREALTGNKFGPAIVKNIQPTKDWRPALEENQIGRYAPGYQLTSKDAKWFWGFFKSVNHDQQGHQDLFNNNKVYPIDVEQVSQTDVIEMASHNENKAFEADSTDHL